MRWHLVGIDKTYLCCEGFKKISTNNRGISQRTDGTNGASWNQSVNFKSINNYFKSSHHGKITVYLDKVHPYLCAVKFW